MATKERTITLPEVRKAAKALDPEETNPASIMAWGNRRPCCFVGHVLRGVGAPLPLPNSLGQSVGTYAMDFAPPRGILLTASAERFLQKAQHAADDGRTWGEAIKAGNRAVAG